jgi:glycine/serine hydroxymethyltransferase
LSYFSVAWWLCQKHVILSQIVCGIFAAVTSRGFKEEDMVEVAHLMALVAKDFDANAEAVRAAVDALCDKYPLFE